MVCFFPLQALIKEFGRKRLQELGDHKRKRLQQRLARKLLGNTPENSPVHKMLNSSADILKKVMAFGRHPTGSSEDVRGHGKVTESGTEAPKQMSKLFSTSARDLVKGVFGIGHNSYSRSQNHLNLKFMPERMFSSETLRRNISKSETNISAKVPLPAPNHVSSQEAPTKTACDGNTLDFHENKTHKPFSLWNLLKANSTPNESQISKQTHYKSVPSSEHEDPKCGEPNSPEQITVVVDTEESDLEPDSPGTSSDSNNSESHFAADGQGADFNDQHPNTDQHRTSVQGSSDTSATHTEVLHHGRNLSLPKEALNSESRCSLHSDGDIVLNVPVYRARSLQLPTSTTETQSLLDPSCDSPCDLQPLTSASSNDVPDLRCFPFSSFEFKF